MLRRLAQFVELQHVNISPTPDFAKGAGLTSSLMDDHSVLLTYLVTPFSFKTSRPNCLFTSGEPLPNESVSDMDLEPGLAGSLAAPMPGELFPAPPAVVGLGMEPRRPPMVFSSLGYTAPASGEFPALEGWRTDSTSICPLSSSTIPSSFRRRFINSSSRSLEGCFVGALGSFGRGRRGARPGAGKIHGIWARRQLEQGMCLSQRTFASMLVRGHGRQDAERTFLLRHVTQLRGFKADDGAAVGE